MKFFSPSAGVRVQGEEPVFSDTTSLSAGAALTASMKISYAGTDCLYVPCTQLDLVSKYIGAGGEDKPVKLSKMGGTEWARSRSRAKAAAKDLAKGLLQLYAQRQREPGHAFSPDSEWQREFEENFEYTETDDQLRCISEIKADMNAAGRMSHCAQAEKRRGSFSVPPSRKHTLVSTEPVTSSTGTAPFSTGRASETVTGVRFFALAVVKASTSTRPSTQNSSGRNTVAVPETVFSGPSAASRPRNSITAENTQGRLEGYTVEMNRSAPERRMKPQ